MNEIEYLADRLIKEASVLRVSDIHIVPRKDDAAVRFRLDGLLMEKEVLTKEICDRLITHFKFLAGMDIGERRRPQSGAMETKQQGEIIHLRLSTLPTSYDESLVIRLLPQNLFLPLSQLSLFANAAKTLLSLFQQPQGLIIFTGPAGSGKTTTLYTLLRVCQSKWNRNVITLEDPVEKRIDNILQVQINEKAGITYANGLKAALRHDPNIIMIGEIRDAETAKIAVRSSMTGHLIASTMHTKNAVGAIYRLREFGIPLHDIEQTLLAVTAQRLVDLVCPFCGEHCSPFCRKHRHIRRAAVHELLYGDALSDAIQSVQNGRKTYRYYTLQNVIRKGVALGFLPPRLLCAKEGENE
ncbi:competence type IV pilus ATPase ComGA [Parageobacillus thermoglucosidasius]|uniref:competence type IV pilus ATPase ComGA n=1 Tax=Parageobacillus thermoglucosidasius TaxID=1426 RepID=UPI000B569C5A|nr:competence type IV pilus ATPase ComGA [Parageobacillus thermoglucosidasius]MBY6269438.1 competence protein ComG [Parageobacillus thermoglucosidasius]MED4905162.1 competence type IV pilus ATPase ComGA [Parageobacillus thermoglucosidasius]MED4913387.1 competence type IV pilus ATPase ComGA [Parageobacillus thermoglucosidasius]MED4944574.1 competence type IV pilus ATPase ComGA [Parageobacillus thermoglucosidasius]MED4984623.1 competence type IV pilus ATPase ComGA [Parageobacillus thermoglucosid